MSNRLRTDDANRCSGMESSRQAELAASGVISPCVLASLHDLFPGCPVPATNYSSLELATTGKAHLLELALKRLPSDGFILEASQQLVAEGVPVSPNKPANHRFDDAEVDDLLLMASQALESATIKAQLGTRQEWFFIPCTDYRLHRANCSVRSFLQAIRIFMNFV